MKQEFLSLLRCPRCFAELRLSVFRLDDREVREGRLICTGRQPHVYEIEDGIIRLAAGFDHEAVQREIAYENSTYQGSDRLTDPEIIAQFPETLAELWPHTRHFGPDFAELIDFLGVGSGKWVLDIGTGPCWSSRLLAERGARVIALDVNEANFYGLKTSDILFREHKIYFERILESMTHLPLQDHSIDCITFNASFHHTPDMRRSLAECFRVLKPGGKIGMVNEEFASFRQRLFSRDNHSDTGSHHTIHYSDFEKAVRKHGFKIQYLVAQHVREHLRGRFPGPVSTGLVRLMETFPLTLKQLNSAVVILTKPRRAGAASPGHKTVKPHSTPQPLEASNERAHG